MTHSIALVAAVLCLPAALTAQTKPRKRPMPLEMVLAETRPLADPRLARPPLVLWTPNFPAGADDAELERTLKQLKARGIALLHRWRGNFNKSAAAAIRIGRLQKKLAMPICIDATGVAHGFFDGSKELGHVDKRGRRFFDTSFPWRPGCAFTVHKRYGQRRKVVEAYLRKYKKAGLVIDYWLCDFEIDGPNEWNGGWAAAKKCVVCRKKIKDIDTDFAAFQKAVRRVRTRMQNEVFCKPVRKHFPNARIGNYGMNPHDGYRYWWDYFEKPDPKLPHKKEDKAMYRPWADEFAGSGYNLAMPVVYARRRTFDSYSFANRDYRWFYNMLLEASSVGRSAPADLPVMPFVFGGLDRQGGKSAPDFAPLSVAKYEELLWHMLLRGADGFAIWSPGRDTAVEVRPVHRVWAASLKFREFLDRGVPVTFDVPKRPGPVVSALRLGDRLLVRRTDFTDLDKPVKLKVGGKTIEIPRAKGKCLLLKLPK